MLCTVCSKLQFDEHARGKAQKFHVSVKALEASAIHGCALCQLVATHVRSTPSALPERKASPWTFSLEDVRDRHEEQGLLNSGFARALIKSQEGRILNHSLVLDVYADAGKLSSSNQAFHDLTVARVISSSIWSHSRTTNIGKFFVVSFC